MYLSVDNSVKEHPVLHIIDEGTNFQAASFLSKCDTKNIWNTFLKIWASAYIGFLESVLTDQGSVFMSIEWKFNCESEEIDLFHTGTESHNSLSSGETYHTILRRVFNKTKSEYTNLQAYIVLALTVKAINRTVGPKGLFPQLLVFGLLPHQPSISTREFPSQIDRIKALHTAKEEYEKIFSKLIVNRGLKKIPPPASDHVYIPGDFVYAYREGLKSYTGPHIVAYVDGKTFGLILVKTQDQGHSTFLRLSLHQLRKLHILCY